MPGKARCAMPSELVDAIVTASFSTGDSVVKDRRAAGPASSAPCLIRRGCVTLSRTEDGITLDISAAKDFAVDIITARRIAADGSARNSGPTRQRGGWQRGGWLDGEGGAQ